MQFEYFIAKKIYGGKQDGKNVSRPAIRIATIGITLGLAVMIVAVSVVVGFKQDIRDKVIGFTSEVRISNASDQRSVKEYNIQFHDSLKKVVESVPEVAHYQRYSQKNGMIKTNDNFQGMVLKGVGQEYDMSFYRSHLVAGKVPDFSDKEPSKQILISQSMCDMLGLKLGDKVYTYYIEDNIRVRRFQIAGIFETHLSEYDKNFVLTDIYTVNQLNKWNDDQCSGVEIRLKDFSMLNTGCTHLRKKINARSDNYGNYYSVSKITELTPQIFAWLGLLDMNVWIILGLMLAVAAFSMVSGLLIIILERTNMIGILKALGASNTQMRKVFLHFSVFVIGKGMIFGNVIGLGICLIQKYTGLIHLNPQNYYVDSVPIIMNIPLILLLNVGTFVISMVVLIAPSYMVSRILPAKSIRFE